MTYETPAITELGTVAEFTQANFFQQSYDGTTYLGVIQGTTNHPTS